MWSPFWSILVCKILQFFANATNLDNHHTFIESKHPEVAKNPCYVLSPEESQKTVSAHGLYVIIQSNPWNITFKVATKFYFMHCLHVAIILFSTGLYKSVFSITLDMQLSFKSFQWKLLFCQAYYTILFNLTNLAFEFVFIIERIFCLP